MAELHRAGFKPALPCYGPPLAGDVRDSLPAGGEGWGGGAYPTEANAKGADRYRNGSSPLPAWGWARPN